MRHSLIIVLVCFLLLPNSVKANDGFLQKLQPLLEQDDEFTLQMIAQLNALDDEYPEQHGRIQLELARLYIRVADWFAANRALNNVLALDELPQAVEARIYLLKQSIKQWQAAPAWKKQVLISARYGHDYRVEDSFNSQSAAIRLKMNDSTYWSVLNRTVQLTPILTLKGIQQHYDEYGYYRYAELNSGVQVYSGKWYWLQEIGLAERYRETGVVSDTKLNYQFNSQWQGYVYWNVFRSKDQLKREAGANLRWRLASAWRVSWDLGKEDRLVDIYSYSRERFETQLQWRPGPVLTLRHRQALTDDGFNEFDQRLSWPISKTLSVTQGISWQQDSAWSIASGYVGVQWKP